jgi:hypothetical protein
LAAVKAEKKAMPQGLKPCVVLGGDAKAKALAYLEAKTGSVWQDGGHQALL